MALPKNDKIRLTVAEYLTFERSSEERHELFDYEIYAMSGASREHGLISTNLIVSLGSQLKNRSCELFASDMRVKVDQASYFYPDVVVACGKPTFEDSTLDTLINPTIVFEILSPSTERYDRGRKFQKYRTISSLLTYVLVDTEEPYIEVFSRQENGLWILSAFEGLLGEVPLSAINCNLLMADVYSRVFPAQDSSM